MTKSFKLRSELVVMCGIPGIGKSYVAENFFPYHQRVNLDSIHEMLSPGGFDKKNLRLARTIEETIINDCLVREIPLIVDNTNITKENRKKYIDFAGKFNVDIKAVYFEPDQKLAIEQNSKRERKVPLVAIYRMVKDFEMPSISEGFSQVYSAKNLGAMFGNKPAVLFDRDGVILKTKVDGKDHFVNRVEDIVFYENSMEAMKQFSNKGYDLFLISNQAGISFGKMTEKDLEDINDHLIETFKKNGIEIKEIYCCTHGTNLNCKCRKPRTGMVIQAACEHNINLNTSYFVGDMTSDILLGNRLGLKTILVETGFGGSDGKYTSTPDFVAKDIYEASKLVTKLR
jgi:D-glycero-D-manno-heptose 1,7-bisphosphate phosphatase